MNEYIRIPTATFFISLATYCGKKICNKKIEEEDIFLIKKARSYFDSIKEGLNYIRNWEKIGLSFNPEVLQALNNLNEFFFIVKDKNSSKSIDSLIEKFERTFDISNKEKNIEEIKEVSHLCTRLQEKYYKKLTQKRQREDAKLSYRL